MAVSRRKRTSRVRGSRVRRTNYRSSRRGRTSRKGRTSRRGRTPRKTTGSRACPPGKIRRKAYSRKAYVRKDGSRVKATRIRSRCIKDRGKKGKGPYVLPKPKKGKLSAFGYYYKESAAKRRAAIKKTINALARDKGISRYDAALSTFRGINLRATYLKNTDPKAHDTMKTDMEWIKKQYKIGQ